MQPDSATPSSHSPSLPASGAKDLPHQWRPPPAHWGVRVASYVLMGAGLLLIMLNGLLVGLLAACAGYTFTLFWCTRFGSSAAFPLR